MERPSPSYDFVFGGGRFNSYFFVTRHGVTYEVKFKPSDYLFAEYPAFHDDVNEFVIEVAETASGNRVPSDALIPPTVALIFFHFFQNHHRIIVYICDSSDAREASRYRKFNAWFERFQADVFLKVDVQITEPSGIIFTSLILHRSNPDLPAIVSAFNEVTRSGEAGK